MIEEKEGKKERRKSIFRNINMMNNKKKKLKKN